MQWIENSFIVCVVHTCTYTHIEREREKTVSILSGSVTVFCVRVCVCVCVVVRLYEVVVVVVIIIIVGVNGVWYPINTHTQRNLESSLLSICFFVYFHHFVHGDNFHFIHSGVWIWIIVFQSFNWLSNCLVSVFGEKTLNQRTPTIKQISITTSPTHMNLIIVVQNYGAKNCFLTVEWKTKNSNFLFTLQKFLWSAHYSPIILSSDQHNHDEKKISFK